MTAARTPKGRILCTEDDPDSRELIVCILETADYHVTITADSAEALSLAQREQFDLIIVDNWMPGWKCSVSSESCEKRPKSASHSESRALACKRLRVLSV